MWKTTSIFAAAALVVTSFTLSSKPVEAGGEGVAAGIIGFTAGAIVGSQLSKQKQRPVYRQQPRRTKVYSGRSAEERAYWKSVQAALNTIGFNAGPVDGAPGRKTKAAVRAFQASLPAEPTGILTPDQTRMLFAKANPQAYAPQQTYVAPPPGYQYQPNQAYPNVTLPNTVPVTAQPANPAVTFPAPATAGQPPALPPAAPAQAFPNAAAPTVTVNAPANPALTFPATNAPQATAGLPAAAPAQSFPNATSQGSDVASVATHEMPEGSGGVVTFPAVEGSNSPALSVDSPEAPEAPPAPAAQAQILVDENGQPYVLVNGQKFLLQAAPAQSAQ